MSANITAPAVRTLSVSKSSGMAISTQRSRLLRRAIPVRSQEGRNRCYQLLRRLLSNPVSAVRDYLALHVVGNQAHGVRDAFAEGFAAPNCEDGQRQLVILPLLVLGDGDIDRPIRGKAATERVAARREAFDVVLHDGFRERRARRLRVLRPKVDRFPALNERFIDRAVEAVERDMPQPRVCWAWHQAGR